MVDKKVNRCIGSTTQDKIKMEPINDKCQYSRTQNARVFESFAMCGTIWMCIDI